LGSEMGSTERVKYAKSTLVPIKSKGDYYFVVCTKPIELRKTKSDKAVRRSTKTRDYREATRLWDKIEAEIYSEFDAALKRDPFLELAKKYWEKDQTNFPLKKFISSLKASDIIAEVDHNREVKEYLEDLDNGDGTAEVPEYIYSGSGVRIPTDFKERYSVSAEAKYKIRILEELIGNDLINETEVEQFFQYLDYDEALEVRYYLHTMKPKNPYPLHLQAKQKEAELAEVAIKETRKNSKATKSSTAIVNPTGCPTILDSLPRYMRAKKWENVRNKTKKYTPHYIHKCVEIIGNLPLDQVQNFHADNIAEELDMEGKANSTIKTYVNSLGGLLTWATTHERNKNLDIEKSWIASNVFKGVPLADWGAQKRPWEALTTGQLHHLFSLQMSPKERLLFTLLITTGMRLDEVCLLRWEQIKTDVNGIRYIDLSINPIKNDKFSKRNVAIPDVVSLPQREAGRLFNYTLDDDKKSSKAASRKLNEKYLHKIRLNEKDDRKVVHSLRHNVSGFMLNLRPVPSSEHMDWITGHDMDGSKTESERTRTYGQDPDVSIKYEILNRIEHPWLNQDALQVHPK